MDMFTLAMMKKFGGGGGVSSWNDLTDKPFGEELVEIVPPQEVIGEESEGLYMVQLVGAAFTGEEKNVIVTFDGVEYTCPLVGVEYGYNSFGNLALIDPGIADTGEPFWLDAFGLIMGAPVLIVVEGATHTVSISTVRVNQLDPKYVNTCAVFYINATITGSGPEDVYIYTNRNLTNKATANEVMAAAYDMPIQIYGMLPALQAVLGVLTPMVVLQADAFATIGVLNWQSSDAAQLKFYTAEYTV